MTGQVPAWEVAVGNVRARPETGLLQFDFRYKGRRCREQTKLPDTAQNRKKCEAVLRKIEARIELDQFDYGSFFPNSPNLKHFCSTKIEAQEVTAEPEKETPTFGDFAQTWLAENKIRWRASHTKNVVNIVNNKLIPVFGEFMLSEIKKAKIMAFRADLASGTLKKTVKEAKPLSAKTVNSNMSVLKLILEEASDRFEFPCPYRNIKRLSQKRTDIQPFTLEELTRFIQNVRPDYRNYYTTRFYTGLRTGEIDGLKWKYVDFARRQILIRETIVDGRVEYTKTDGSQREVPMLGPVFESLKAQFEATGAYEYVFCNRSGAPLEHSNIRKRIWYPTLSLLGLARRRPYETRHTCATLLLASGENPEWVARFLGHTTTEMLFKVYSRFIPNATRQDGSAFERLVVKQRGFEEEDNAE